MAKSGRKVNRAGRSKFGPPHVRLHMWLLDSKAYRALSPTAKAMLVAFYRRYDGRNNGRLFLSLRGAAKDIGVASVNTALRAINDLILLGFIRVKSIGSFTLKARHATEWILTEFSYADRPPTKDFMKFEECSVDEIRQLLKVEAEAQKSKTRYQKSMLTVSNSDTEPATPSRQRLPTVSNSDTDAGPYPPLSVSKCDTQVMYHGGGVTNDVLLPLDSSLAVLRFPSASKRRRASSA